MAYLEEAAARVRSRGSWNARLEHWQRPASDHEENKIARASNAAARIISENKVLCEEKVVARPQGSYFNNTNVRLDSDMDIRIQLPGVYIQYFSSVDKDDAYRRLGYRNTGRSFAEISANVREALATECRRRFGAANVNVGGKAVTVSGLENSRADADLVPAFILHYIGQHNGNYNITEGVAIFSPSGNPILNFPDQHHRNGIEKRSSTSHRFKKIVRMLKKLNYELADLKMIERSAPSFLVECLAFCVEDHYYMISSDDHFLRLKRVVDRIQSLLRDNAWVQQATEVNRIKFLFRSGQAWSLDVATSFADAAARRLSSELV